MPVQTMDITISSGGGTSETVALLDGFAVGFITPAALTSTAFTFTVCDTSSGTFVPLYDSAGNQISVTVTTSRAYVLTGAEADAVAPWPFIKFVGNGSEAADRTLVVSKK